MAGAAGPCKCIDGATGAVGMQWRGVYDNASEYNFRDGVSFEGSSYIRKSVAEQTPSAGHLPTDTNFWDVIATRSDANGTIAAKWVIKSIGDLTQIPGTPGGIYCGPFFPAEGGLDLGAFFWQIWICPAPGGGGFLIRDTVDGRHTFLTGTTDEAGGHRFIHYGDHNSQAVSFASDLLDLIQDNEWAHVAWGKTNKEVSPGVRYDWITIDGILSYYGPNAFDRITYAGATGLSLFGNNHQGWAGKLAWIQGWDADNDAFGSGSIYSLPFGLRPSFVPQVSRINHHSAVVYPDFSMNFNVPGSLIDTGTNQDRLFKTAPFYKAEATYSTGNVVQDLGIIYVALATTTGDTPASSPSKWAPSLSRFTIQHHGMLLNEADLESARPVNEHPFWVIDETCPAGSFNPHPVQAASYIGPVVAPPTEEGITWLAWDGFGGRRSTKSEDDQPTLGSTEAGTLGPKVWLSSVSDTSNSYYSGIRNGYAINLANGSNFKLTGMWIDCETPNHAVQSEMAPGTLQAIFADGPGVIFRKIDADNQWQALVSGGRVYVKKWVAGSLTDVANYAMVSGFTNLRVKVNSAHLISVYSGVSKIGPWTLIGSFTDSDNAAGTLVGGNNASGNALRRVNWGCYATT